MGYLPSIVALISLCIASATLMKAGWWPGNGIQEIIGWTGAIILTLAALLLAAVVLASRRIGPTFMLDWVESWMSPPDSKWYPDMKLVDLVKRQSPQFVASPNEGLVIAEQQEGAAATLRQVGRLASLGKLQVFGFRRDRDIGTIAANPTRIAEQFWVDGGHIDYSDFISDTEGKASRRYGVGMEEIYVGLEFDSRQVRRAFPRRGGRISLRKPWTSNP
jgi:hypothetical protein